MSPENFEVNVLQVLQNVHVNIGASFKEHQLQDPRGQAGFVRTRPVPHVADGENEEDAGEDEDQNGVEGANINDGVILTDIFLGVIIFLVDFVQ
jgi:hypothetical protein